MIIILFKLPKWIDSDNAYIVKNSHPFAKHYLKRNYHDFIWLADYPEMAEIILEKQAVIIPDLFGKPESTIDKINN